MSSFEERPRLGSLAQSARGKHLNQIRGILILIGILMILGYCALLATLEEQVNKAFDDQVRKRGFIGQVDPVQKAEWIKMTIRINKIVFIAMIAVGGLYLLLAAIVHQYPVAVTVIALIIYVGAFITFAALNPENLLQGLWIKIFITVALAGSIKTAIEYERERSRDRLEDEDDNE